MNALEETDIACPSCGEVIRVLVDCCDLGQQYVEDCPVCCSPMLLTIVPDAGGGFRVEAVREGD